MRRVFELPVWWSAATDSAALAVGWRARFT
jgi:hypothetical protein